MFFADGTTVVRSQGKPLTVRARPVLGARKTRPFSRSTLEGRIVQWTPAWAAAHGIDAGTDPEALAGHPAVLAEIDRAVAAANSRLNRTEQVKRYRVLPREWGPATGELTPSLKMRRRVIKDKYATELTDLYDG